MEATERGSGAASTTASFFFHRVKDTDRNLQRRASSHQGPVSVVIVHCPNGASRTQARAAQQPYPSVYRRLSNPTSTRNDNRAYYCAILSIPRAAHRKANGEMGRGTYPEKETRKPVCSAVGVGWQERVGALGLAGIRARV